MDIVAQGSGGVDAGIECQARVQVDRDRFAVALQELLITDRVSTGQVSIAQRGQSAAAAFGQIVLYGRRVIEIRQIGLVQVGVAWVVEEQREIGRVAGGQVVVAGGHHVGVAIFRHPQRGIGRRLTIFCTMMVSVLWSPTSMKLPLSTTSAVQVCWVAAITGVGAAVGFSRSSNG